MRGMWNIAGAAFISKPPSTRCQVKRFHLDVGATVLATRAPAQPYVTALAPLLARWLKRRRKQHEKTCERSERT